MVEVRIENNIPDEVSVTVVEGEAHKVVDVMIDETPVDQPVKKQTEAELKQLLIGVLELAIPKSALEERRGYILSTAAQDIVDLIGGDTELKSGAHVKVVQPLHQDFVNLCKHAIGEYVKRRAHLSEVNHMVPPNILRRYLDEHADAKEAQIVAKILRDDVRG